MAKYEEKFIVFNKSDLIRAKISKDLIRALNDIDNQIQLSRIRRKANQFPKYYVCNQDEPYAQEVIDTILNGEKVKGL